MGLETLGKHAVYPLALLVTGCGVLSGGYVEVSKNEKTSISYYEPEEGWQFAQATSQVLQALRLEASRGRIASAGGLIPLTAIIGYKTVRNQSPNAIAALLATGAAVYGTRDYILAPRYERIYSRAEKAVNCAIGEYAAAQTSGGPRILPERVRAYAALRALNYQIKQIENSYGADAENYREELAYLTSVANATDIYANGPMYAQSGLLYKAVLRIISQANQQIADDQPNLAEDKALFGAQFAKSNAPSVPATSGVLKQFEQSEQLLTVGPAVTPGAAAVTVTEEERKRIKALKPVNDALKMSYEAVTKYTESSKKALPPPPLTYAANYDACVYEQIAGARPPLLRPLTLGANDADQGTSKSVSDSKPVWVAVSGGVGNIVASVLNPPEKNPPIARVMSTATGPVVQVTVDANTPANTYEIIVKDDAGTMKQFSVIKN